MAFRIHKKTFHLWISFFSWFFSSLVQHLRKTIRRNFSVFICLRTLNTVLSHHWNPLIIPTFSFFSNKKRRNFFFHFLLFYTFDCWVLSVVSGDCGVTTRSAVSYWRRRKRRRRKSEIEEERKMSTAKRCQSAKVIFPLAFGKRDNKLSMQLYAIFCSYFFFFFFFFFNIRFPPFHQLEWMKYKNCDGFIWFFSHFHRT